MFTGKFNKYACEGDTIACEKDGFTIVARIERDYDMGPPWKEHDGHGPVSEWRPRESKRPGEVILCEDRGSCRFYDWQEAIRIAKRDGWGFMPYRVNAEYDNPSRDQYETCGGTVTAGPFTAYDKHDINKAVGDVYRQHRETMTPGEYAHGAVKRDFESMKAWCNDEWGWCFIVLSVSKNGILVDDCAASLGGIELNHPQSDNGNEYLTDVANQILDEAIESARSRVDTIVNSLTS